MKNKKSLLSVLLAAVLLCACVAGMLIFGASAEGEALAPVIYNVDAESTGTAANPGENYTFRNINAAMEYAFAQTWPAGSSLVIRFAQQNVSYDCSSHNTLFKGQRTAASALGGVATGRIVRLDGEGLPITVQYGDGTQTLYLALDKSGETFGLVYVINDFIIKNAEITWPQYKTMRMQVAAERVEFYNCDFVDTSVPDADHAAHYVSTIAANGYTSGNYGFKEATLAARRDAYGKIQSEIVFSGNSSTTLTSTKVDKTNYYYGVFIAGQYNVTTGNFASTVTVGEDSVRRSDLVGKITVKDNANLAYVAATISTNLRKGIVEVESGTVRNLAGYSCPTASDAEVIREAIVNVRGGTCTTVSGMLVYPGIAANKGTINKDTTVQVNCHAGTYNEVACALGNGLTMKNGSQITVNVLGGQVKQRIVGLYSGSSYGVKMESGSIATLNVSGGSNHCTSTNSSTHRLLGIVSEYAPMEICEGATLNINLSGANTKIGRSIYCIYSTSAGSASRVPNVKMDGALNLNLTGGNYNEIFGVYENVGETTTDPSVGVGATGALKIMVDGATVGDVTLACNGTKTAGAGKALVAGVIDLEYMSGALGNITGAQFLSASADTSKEITGSITVTMKADTEYDKNIVVLGEGAVVDNGGSVGVILEKGTFSGSIQTFDGEPTVEEGGVCYVTINGGTFKGVVDGDGVALNGNVSILEGGQINADTVAEGVTVTVDNQGFDKIYMTAAAGSAQVAFTAEEGKNPLIIGDTEKGYQVRGWYLPVSATLILTERVEVKLTMSKALAEEYVSLVGKNYQMTITFDGDTAGAFVVDPDDSTLLYVTLEGRGANEFDLPIQYQFEGKNVVSMTICDIAEAGSTMEGATAEEKALFKALYDYGVAANKMGQLKYFTEDATAALATLVPDCANPVNGAGSVNFNAMTLLMGDTIGIRLKTRDIAALNAITKVEVNGIEVPDDTYRISTNEAGTEAYLDLYVHAEKYNTKLSIQVYDKDTVPCVEVLETSVSKIATALMALDFTEKEDAQRNVQSVVALVLAVHNYNPAQTAA